MKRGKLNPRSFPSALRPKVLCPRGRQLDYPPPPVPVSWEENILFLLSSPALLFKLSHDRGEQIRALLIGSLCRAHWLVALASLLSAFSRLCSSRPLPLSLFFLKSPRDGGESRDFREPVRKGHKQNKPQSGMEGPGQGCSLSRRGPPNWDAPHSPRWAGVSGKKLKGGGDAAGALKARRGSSSPRGGVTAPPALKWGRKDGKSNSSSLCWVRARESVLEDTEWQGGWWGGRTINRCNNLGGGDQVGWRPLSLERRGELVLNEGKRKLLLLLLMQ